MPENKSTDQDQLEIADTVRPVAASELARDLSEMPEPSTPDPENPNRADNATVAPPAPVPAAHTPQNLVDAKGKKFDPDIHRADDQGRPMRDKKGCFYSKNIGRPATRSIAAPPAPHRAPPTFSDPGTEPLPFSDTPAPPAAPPFASDRFAQLAEVYLYSAYGPIVVLLGEEAKPDDEEHAALKAPLTEYLRSINAHDISPGWAFLITATAVAMKKMEKPTVRERFQLLVMRVKQIGARISARFTPQHRHP